jgi:hypothetical protein
MLGTAIVFGLLLYGGKLWWDGEDTAFAEEMYRPFAAVAAVSDDGALLRLDITDSSWIMRRDTAWIGRHRASRWSRLVSDHGKVMHLFLVREPDLGAFAHLHPTSADSTRFSAALPALPPGRYRVFADIVHESGFAQTLVASVDLPAEGRPASRTLPEDDGSFVGSAKGLVDTLADGTTVTWDRGGTDLVAGAPAPLAFDLREPDGRPARLEPYLGMAAHAVVARDDGKIFIHLHPMGTISTAAQATFMARQRDDTIPGRIGSRVAALDSSMAGMSHGMPMGRVSFPYSFPEPGRYRVWVQVKRAGQVRTAVFDAQVAPAK